MKVEDAIKNVISINSANEPMPINSREDSLVFLKKTIEYLKKDAINADILNMSIYKYIFYICERKYNFKLSESDDLNKFLKSHGILKHPGLHILKCSIAYIIISICSFILLKYALYISYSYLVYILLVTIFAIGINFFHYTNGRYK